MKIPHDFFTTQLDTFDSEMSYLNHFDDLFSTLASARSQNPYATPKIELPPPVVIIDEPSTKTSTNKVYSNPLDHDFVVAPFMERFEKDLERRMGK